MKNQIASVFLKYMQEDVFEDDVESTAEQLSLLNVKKELASNPNDLSFMHRIMEKETFHYRKVRYAPVPGIPRVYVVAIRDVTDLVKEALWTKFAEGNFGLQNLA